MEKENTHELYEEMKHIRIKTHPPVQHRRTAAHEKALCILCATLNSHRFYVCQRLLFCDHKIQTFLTVRSAQLNSPIFFSRASHVTAVLKSFMNSINGLNQLKTFNGTFEFLQFYGKLEVPPKQLIPRPLLLFCFSRVNDVTLRVEYV